MTTVGRADGAGSVGMRSDAENEVLGSAVESLMTAPASGATDDLQTALAVLAVELARQQKRAGDTQREAAMKSQEEAHARKIEKMRELADDTFLQGLFEGAAQVTSATLQIGGAVHGFEGAKAELDARDAGSGALARGYGVRAAVETRASRFYEASSKVASAAGTLGGTTLKAAQDRDRADLAVIDRDVDRAKSDVDGASAQSKEAEDDIRQAMDFIRQYIATKTQTAQAAIMKG